MPLSATQRKALAAQANRLKAVVTISADVITPAVIDHVRHCFTERALLKLRINAPSGDECDAAVQRLVAEVPCERIARVGRVAVLYRPLPTETEAAQ